MRSELKRKTIGLRTWRSWELAGGERWIRGRKKIIFDIRGQKRRQIICRSLREATWGGERWREG